MKMNLSTSKQDTAHTFSLPGKLLLQTQEKKQMLYLCDCFEGYRVFSCMMGSACYKPLKIENPSVLENLPKDLEAKKSFLTEFFIKKQGNCCVLSPPASVLGKTHLSYTQDDLNRLKRQKTNQEEGKVSLKKDLFSERKNLQKKYLAYDEEALLEVFDQCQFDSSIDDLGNTFLHHLVQRNYQRLIKKIYEELDSVVKLNFPIEQGI